MFKQAIQTLLLASTLALPCVTQASVDLDSILSSQDFEMTDAEGRLLKVLRAQVVSDADGTVSSSTQLNTTWLRITHLGLAPNSAYNISIEVDFPPAYAGQLLWQALGPNGTGAGTYPIDANGRATLTIPNINRGFTAEIRMPKVDATTKPNVNVIAVDGFTGITRLDPLRRPRY